MNHVGIPDGVSAGVDEKGEPVFYFAILSLFPDMIVRFVDWPSIRQLLLYLPRGLSAPIPRWGFIVRTDKNGVATRTWQDHSGETSQLTSVETTKGGLYVGGLHNNFVGFLKVDK
ncbi:hypothetical protein SARC_16148 [Sphaeroforma arctica JP610]|uniref:Strictosidine synthase conserved region domain-containing protein n=1 Tax=Sphaeroforma arctica JP610 TaxID=667725 RepID=A0A0L0F3X4_9EUKA|nr:hypothetical protein SARC_16148 [Sphaeroforma arctica JP610]KNC71316.1 hypothetical protein SARC_16148 [Sphaeroforma arctica JP610]|eukprot:XP_014145218.1 hypothetical protein SARC_16148 [Sphaeroforma arctica JP610]